MRHINARSRGWLVILLVLFLCFAACMSQGMGFAPAAYSPTASKNELAGRHAPGGGGYSANHDAADNFILTPEQSVRLWKEGECVRHHPALEPSLPSMNITSCHAVFTMMYQRPRSELASRSGGHAPPRKKASNP